MFSGRLRHLLLGLFFLVLLLPMSAEAIKPQDLAEQYELVYHAKSFFGYVDNDSIKVLEDTEKRSRIQARVFVIYSKTGHVVESTLIADFDRTRSFKNLKAQMKQANPRWSDNEAKERIMDAWYHGVTGELKDSVIWDVNGELSQETIFYSIWDKWGLGDGSPYSSMAHYLYYKVHNKESYSMVPPNSLYVVTGR